MERQKVLWIIFSVALFVLVVVGIGIIWFLPGDRQAGGLTAAQKPNDSKITFDPYEWAKSDTNTYPGLEGPQSSGQQNKDFTLIYGQNPTQPATNPQPQAAGNQVVPAQSPATGPAHTVTPPPTRTAPAPRTNAAAPSTPARGNENWIQAASYTSNFRAEEAKKLLDANGLASTIVSHDVNGTTYFRVRIGPYANLDEANRFLAQVKQINGFQDSYVTAGYVAAAGH